MLGSVWGFSFNTKMSKSLKYYGETKQKFEAKIMRAVPHYHKKVSKTFDG